MTFLPIVERELRAAARRRGSYWLRSGYGFLAIVIGTFVFLAYIDSSSQRIGQHLFRTLAWLSMPYCLLCGIRWTADCLSQEKREGTLGLLFLTDLKGYDVILGKLVATSLSGFYGLLATFPILAVPLLLGGITNPQFWCELLVLVNTFLFSLAIGIFVSVLSRQSRHAMSATFGIILLFTAVLPACAGAVLYFAPGYRTDVARLLLLPCPVYALSQTLRLPSTGGLAMDLFWSVLIAHGLCWLLLALASWRVAGSWQDKPAKGLWSWWRAWRHNRTFGNAVQRKRLRTRLLNVNTFYWAAARARPRPLYWRLLGIIAVVWVWAAIRFGADWFNEAVYFSTAIILNCSFKTWVASESGRYLGEQRKDGALEFVLSTPLSVKEILRGQWLALRRLFLGPLLAVVAVQLIFFAASLQREPFSQNSLNPVLWIASILVLIADTAALCWTAMWGALTVKSPNVITGVTMTRILLAPWGLFVVVLIMANLVSTPGSPDFTWKFFVALWFGVSLVIDLAFGLGSWWALHTKFRQLALQPFVSLSSQCALFLQQIKRLTAGAWACATTRSQTKSPLTQS
jgi:ABC-type transport system involved in multi-copper enzyme maturation permease subunit